MKNTGKIVFKNCYAHILSFGNSNYNYNGGFVTEVVHTNIYL